MSPRTLSRIRGLAHGKRFHRATSNQSDRRRKEFHRKWCAGLDGQEREKWECIKEMIKFFKKWLLCKILKHRFFGFPSDGKTERLLLGLYLIYKRDCALCNKKIVLAPNNSRHICKE